VLPRLLRPLLKDRPAIPQLLIVGQKFDRSIRIHPRLADVQLNLNHRKAARVHHRRQVLYMQL